MLINYQGLFLIRMRFYSREKDTAVTGRFQTEEEFGKAIALRSKTYVERIR
jgi:hypothetical protein